MSGLNPAAAILLFDIDGVLVTTLRGVGDGDAMVLRLHANTREFFSEARLPIGFLTHRTKAEAERILVALGILPEVPKFLICANDLVLEALRRLKWVSLLKAGLVKSLAMPIVCRRFACRPEQVVVVDDLPENLMLLIRSGCGLALQSPAKPLISSRTAISFDLASVLAHVETWSAIGAENRVMLDPQLEFLGAWAPLNLGPNLGNVTLFSMLRTIGKCLRSRWP
ncbi:MAG: HAD family hydrolase [Desulfosarcinaceae bacterium]|nr:HAD family hydrolase [Desulfosarcinaceae bacterium]